MPPESPPRTAGGGRTFPFDAAVESVQLLLKTDGRPLNARIELLQGPSNNKQVIELYTEDGCDRPFFCHLETPDDGNVVRVVNTSPVEFPMTASVVPHAVAPELGYRMPGGFMQGGRGAYAEAVRRARGPLDARLMELDDLKSDGRISNAEYESLRAQALTDAGQGSGN